MKKYKLIITILSVILVLLVVLSVFIWSRDSSEYLYDPSNFFGTWEAVECVGVDKIQRTDFYPEKYIGHRIYISEDSFYMVFWEDILPEEEVALWMIEAIDLEEFFTVKIHCDKPFPVSNEKNIALQYIKYKDSRIERHLGFIIDADTLICPTSSGWYRYEKID